MKSGDRVKVICSIDSACPADRIGNIGILLAVNTQFSDMLIVKFPDGYRDSYWPEELELL